MTFRALKPDGVLFYVASSTTSTPVNYFAIYLYRGLISIDMMTSTQESSINLNQYTYNDGNWHQVRCFGQWRFYDGANGDLAPPVQNQAPPVSNSTSPPRTPSPLGHHKIQGLSPSSLTSLKPPLVLEDVCIGF